MLQPTEPPGQRIMSFIAKISLEFPRPWRDTRFGPVSYKGEEINITRFVWYFLGQHCPVELPETVEMF